MDNNPNPYQFQGQNPQGQQNVPPPPPSQEAQMGVRTMQSDLESIKQSGGEAPQSQIISAPELAQSAQYSNPVPEAAPAAQPAAPIVPQESAAPIAPAPEMKAPVKFNLKTVLIVIGGIIVAAGIGYGVYYLVSSLGQAPQVAIPQPSAQLPVAAQPTTTPSVATTTPAAPVIAPLVHASLISSPTKSETLTLPDGTLQSFEAAIASSSKEKLAVGSVKDLAFVDASGTPIESSAAIGAYFAPQTFSLTPLFERDFTSWLYYNSAGGAKLGMVFQLKPSVALSQASSTVRAALEGMTSNIAGFFVSNPAVPTDVAFKDGQVGGVPVRFLVYSLSGADAFEYGWYSIGQTNYLVMATGYNQMVDIIKRLKAIPVPAPSISATSTQPAVTSTATTTTH